MLYLKVKYFPLFIKSKLLKKKSKITFKRDKENFKNLILNKKLSVKWFLNNLEIFSFFLPKDKNRVFNYLEIGCYEGLSALYVMDRYKNVNATLVDLWDLPNRNSLPLTNNFEKVEENFNFNLKDYDFHKVKQDSVIAMRDLYKKKIFFDFIYIDGSHNGEDILSDAIEAFKLLKINGYIFFDDFLQHDKDRKIQSYDGIESFLLLFRNYIEIKYFQNNLVIKKIL